MEIKDRFGVAVFTAAVALGVSATATAQTLGTYTINPTKVDDQVVPGFYANVELDLVYDDNILLTDDAVTPSIDSMIFEARPELQWVGTLGKHMARFGYQGYYAWHEARSTSNFDDHYVGGDVTLDLTQKLNVNLTADYREEHEVRTAVALPLGAGPNLWEQWAVAGQVVYGRRVAKAQVALKGEYWERDYTNNGQSFRDYDADALTLTLFYNLGPKTQLLIEPSYTDYVYPNSAQDNDVVRMLAGVTWEATAKTTGEFKIGWHEKEFDIGPTDSGLSLESRIVWKPKSYSTVTGALSRYVYDSAVGGGSLSYEATVANLDWEHDLTALTQFQAGLRYESDSYDTGRDDDLFDAYLGVSYALKRWMTIGARYDYAQRDSSDAGNDYTDNRFMIGVKATYD
jgi:hypothetical protein